MGFIRAFFRFVAHDRCAPCRAICALALVPAATGALAATDAGSDSAQSRRAAPMQSAAAPSLSDLYSVAWEEIPMPESTPANPHLVTPTSIANDGTIAGMDADGMLFWHPDTRTWEQVPRTLALAPVIISPDGSSALATGAPHAQPESTNVLTWNLATDWQALAGSDADQSTVYNVSRNFRFAVGAGGHLGEPSQAWVWDVDGGTQQLLSTPDSAFNASASAVSEDGRVVVGNETRFPQGGDWPESVAIRWVDGGPPTILRDPDGHELYGATACNADCSIIFGSGDIFSAPSWFLKSNGEFGSFGTLPDGEVVPYQYYVGDASADGSLVAGIYSAKADPDNPYSNAYAYMPFLWTPATGLVSLRSLGIEVDWGDFLALRFSPDARHLLIGPALDPWDERTRNWAVVVHLTPKASGPGPAPGHSSHGQPTPPAPGPNRNLRAGSQAVAD